jgi:hypothetical protein
MSRVGYLITIAKEIEETGNADYTTKYVNVEQKLRTLDSELGKLNPSDFLASVQSEFAGARNALHDLVSKPSFFPEQARGLARRLVVALEGYGGEGSGKISRSFDFIKDTALRAIIERDYRELTVRTYPSHAEKSTVILAGSILESILFDQLATDPAVKARAVSSGVAPTDKHDNVLDIEKWRLEDLIRVAAAIAILPKEKEKTIDQTLRDYRNFIHPKKEIRSRLSIGDPEMRLAVAALDGVCDFLASKLSP